MKTNAREIARQGLKYGRTEHAARSIAAGETLPEFRSRLLRAGAAHPVSLGMSRSEIARYSLGAGVRAALDGALGVPSRGGFEAEMHGELAKRQPLPVGPHTLLVPLDIIRDRAAEQTRALTAANAAGGGYLVETGNLGFVGLSLPRSVVGLLGVQRLEGLIGNVTMPVFKTAGAQTDMGPETAQASNVAQTFSQIGLNPKTEGAYFEASHTLLRQTGPSAQAFLANGILASFAARLEFLLLQGTGVAPQPTGLIAAATGSVSGSSLALAGVLSLQTALGDRLDASGAFLTTQTVAALLAGRQKASGTSSFLWEGGIYSGALNGLPAFTTSNVPTGKLLFGSWDYALLASWGDLKIEVNPFANFQAGIVGMRILHDLDVAALDPGAFAVAASVT